MKFKSIRDRITKYRKDGFHLIHGYETYKNSKIGPCGCVLGSIALSYPVNEDKFGSDIRKFVADKIGIDNAVNLEYGFESGFYGCRWPDKYYAPAMDVKIDENNPYYKLGKSLRPQGITWQQAEGIDPL